MKKDIYDMFFNNSFYIKHKMPVLYIFFGGLTFLLNMVLFVIIDRLFPISELINNIICWVTCVTFQYFTNRTWVFDGKTNTKIEFLKQFFSFMGGRVFTLFIEEIILAVFITWLAFNSIIVKLVAQVVVIALNFAISKCFVFK